MGRDKALLEVASEALLGRAVTLMRTIFDEVVVVADHRHDYDPVATQRWADDSDWLNLQVVSVTGGSERDNEGQIEFIATYREKGVLHNHHESGGFLRYRNDWYYTDGKLIPQSTQQHESPKVGRNDPCPCGSGKKYKKCCGR